jgi:hypothetical protein
MKHMRRRDIGGETAKEEEEGALPAAKFAGKVTRK